MKLNQTKLDKVLDDLEFTNNLKANRISDLQKNIAKLSKNMQTSTNHSTICLKSLETCETEKQEIHNKANECHEKYSKMTTENLHATSNSPVSSSTSDSSADKVTDKSTIDKVGEKSSTLMAAETSTDKTTEKPGFFSSIMHALDVPVVVDLECHRERDLCEKVKKNCEQERDMYKFWRQD